MQTLVVETPEGIRLEHVLAGPGSRSAALLIDLALYAGLWIFALVLAVAGNLFGLGSPSQFLVGALGGGMLLFWILMEAALPVFMGGTTPGKRLLGLRIATEEGRRAGPVQYALRALFLPLEMIVVGITVMLLSERSQRLGDLVAGTVVLSASRAPLAAEPLRTESWSTLRRRETPLVPAHAAQLERSDLEFLRMLLGRQELAPKARKRLFVTAARHYAERLGLEQVSDPRLFLRELFLFAREAAERRGAATPAVDRADPGDPGSAPAPPRPRR